MAQTLSLTLELDPRSAPLARAELEALKARAQADGYREFGSAMAMAHFMSMTVFDDYDFDPAFILEANFDGPATAFFKRLEETIGDGLRRLLACVKARPGEAHRLIAQAAAGGSVAAALAACAQQPEIFHHGNRGLSRARIEREAALFNAASAAADDPDLRRKDAVGVHNHLRQTLVAEFPWLRDAPPPSRISLAENLADWARLSLFGAVVLGVLLAPAALFSHAFPTALGPVALVFAVIWGVLRLKALDTPDGRSDLLTTGVGVAALAVLALNLAPQLAPVLVWRWLCVPPGWILGADLILGAVLGLVLLAIWLRSAERADPVQDAPPVDEGEARRMAESEDHWAMNHMVSIVRVKPGVLRAVLIRAGLWGLGYILRVARASRQGYLASMRTIHFAHWALVSDGQRLMFHSNFDGSWENYLDDFIEKAAVGLTAAWTNGIGFPQTRFLILDGATHGRRFKAWARHSMRETLFWFAAYPDLTVNQIERNCRLAEGLRRARLSPAQAATWARDL